MKRGHLKSKKWALVAGGSGFLGQYIVWGLVCNGYSVVLCGTRRNGQNISHRIEKLKKFNEMVNPAFRLNEHQFCAIKAIECDIKDSELALSKNDRQWLQTIPLCEVWNCAAYMKYDVESFEKSYATNVTGTENLINLVKKYPSCKYFHVSTAFIGGKDFTNGAPIRERVYENQKGFFNSYDKSKALAEQKVLELCSEDDLDYSIFRPTIIIGDSKTGFTSSVFGIYEYYGAFDKLRSRLAGKSLSVMCNNNSLAHLIPVDLCAKAMLKLSQLTSTSNTKVYTISDSRPRTYDDMLAIIERIFDISINPIHRVNKNESKYDRLFRRLTAKNHIFSQHSFNFCNKEMCQLIGESICSDWSKNYDFFNLIRDGFNQYVDEYVNFENN